MVQEISTAKLPATSRPPRVHLALRRQCEGMLVADSDLLDAQLLCEVARRTYVYRQTHIGALRRFVLECTHDLWLLGWLKVPVPQLTPIGPSPRVYFSLIVEGDSVRDTHAHVVEAMSLGTECLAEVSHRH